MPGRLSDGVKTGFLNMKKRNIYVSANGRYYANGTDGKRVYAPKARYTSANGSVRTIVATNAIPNKIRPARIAMAPNAAKARAAERRYVRARAIVPYAPPMNNGPNFEPLSTNNVTAAQALTAMRAGRGTSRRTALMMQANRPGNSRFASLIAAAAQAPVPRIRAAPRRVKTAAVLNNVALRGLFGGKVYSGKYKTNEERKAARRESAARYRAKKMAV